MLETFVVIDGNAILHRSYHALPPFKTKQGELVNAVYGFASVLLSILEREKPDYIAVTFDEKGPTFRHEMSKDYKATRVKAPDDLYAQIPRIHEVVTAFNIPLFRKSGFEADDLIGTLADLASRKAVRTVIVTGDMDTAQLVKNDVVLAVPRSGFAKVEYFDPAGVRAKYCVGPEQIVDYKALVGDTSDNIVGVPGIGPKTAVVLLQEYKDLDGIYKNIEHITGAARGKLEKNKDKAYMSQTLAKIVCDVPLEFRLNDCRVHEFEIKNVLDLFEELEFKRLTVRLSEIFKKKFEEHQREAARGKSVIEGEQLAMF